MVGVVQQALQNFMDIFKKVIKNNCMQLCHIILLIYFKETVYDIANCL